jgi:cell division protein FtsL
MVLDMARKKQKKGKFRLIHFIILFLLIYVVIVFNHQRKLLKNLDAKKKMNEAKIEELKKDIEALNKEIESSGTLEFVEKVARDELGMVKPREIIYVDINKPKDPLFNIFKNDN